MNTLRLIALALGTPCAASNAQFIHGNEAVQLAPGGTRRVETPPLPSGRLPAPCPATHPGCAGGGWMMVETRDGLVECTEYYARPGSCRTSTYGFEKRARLWIVKKGSNWLLCQYPDLTSRCVSTGALPYDAVQ